MDPVVCLETDIRKALSNKEIVIAVFLTLKRLMTWCGEKGCY